MKLDRKTAYGIFAVVAAFGLYARSLYGYLLFHSIAELFSIFVAVGIFVVARNTRNFSPNTYLLFIGIAYKGEQATYDVVQPFFKGDENVIFWRAGSGAGMEKSDCLPGGAGC